MDEIHVPSRYYMTQLADQGHDQSRMRLFRRGLDDSFMRVSEAHLRRAKAQWFRKDMPTLLYSGRLGKDKNLGFLADFFKRLRAGNIEARLLFAGEGPARLDLEKALAHFGGHVLFTGRLDRETLKAVYRLSDVLVFPSNSETFGMSVLEAQSLGLPALVSQCGGPQEIVLDGKTGYVLDTDSPDTWVEASRRLCEARARNPVGYQAWRDEIKTAFAGRLSWTHLIDEMTEKKEVTTHCGRASAYSETSPLRSRLRPPHHAPSFETI